MTNKMGLDTLPRYNLYLICLRQIRLLNFSRFKLVLGEKLTNQ